MTREKAIKTVKEFINGTCLHLVDQEALETLIPELKESEDERIIKTLQEYVKNRNWPLNGPTQGEVLAWLERQKECLADNNKTSTDEDERIRKSLIEFLTIIKGISESGRTTWAVREDDAEMCKSSIAYLEKQKDASKAIEAVDRIDKYIDEHLANAHDMKDSNPDKKYYRGWDDALGEMARILQDVYSGEKQKEPQPVEWEWPNLSNCIKNCKKCHGKCFYRKEPYEEQKPLEIHEPSDAELDRHQKELYDFKVFATKQAKEHHISHVHDFEWNNFCAELLSYFNEQKPVEWGDEDSDNLERVDNYLWMLDDYVGDDCAMPQGKTDKIRGNIQGILSPWLKNLPKRFRPQPKQEWSEEETKDLVHILKVLDDCYAYGKHDLSKTDHDNLTSMIKSLRPSWKPSEEQIKYLLMLADYFESEGGTSNAKTLREFSEQLEKLI